MATFSIEDLVDDAIVARLTHSTLLASPFVIQPHYSLTDQTGNAKWISVSSHDEGEEALRSGIRKVRVDVKLHYNLKATGATVAELRSLYDEVIAYLDDADAEAQLTAINPTQLLVIGVRRAGYGSARDIEELMANPTVTRQLLAQNIS